MYITKRFISYGHVKALQVAAVFFLALTTLSLVRRLQEPPRRPSIYDYTEGRTSEWRDWQHKNATPTATVRASEARYLKYLVDAYGLTKEVPWLARRLRPHFSGTGRPSVTNVGQRLVTTSATGFRRVRANDEDLQEQLLRADPKPIKLAMPPSPKPEEADASAILFGVATSYRRLTYADNALLHDWQRWLTDGKGASNGAGLVLSLQRATAQEVAEVRALLQALGIDAEVLASDVQADAYGRYAELAKLLLTRSREQPERRYMALIEDDMFFPNLSKLQQRLGRYAPDKAYYMVAPSERSDWELEDKGSMVTYGGGAVFLTAPMLDKLTDLACLARPDKEDVGDAWDRIMYHCVSRNTDTPLQVLPGFYSPQRDDDALYGGGYGSGLQATTLHHYRNYHRFEAAKGHLVASACGESCFLQRFRFADDWILVNGYTVTHYPDGVEALPLRKKAGRLVVQQPQDDAPETAKTSPSQRLVLAPDETPADLSVIAWRGRKKTWSLLDASLRENGELWQAYVNRRGPAGSGDEFDDRRPADVVNSDEETSDVDSIIVLIWES